MDCNRGVEMFQHVTRKDRPKEIRRIREPLAEVQILNLPEYPRLVLRQSLRRYSSCGMQELRSKRNFGNPDVGSYVRIDPSRQRLVKAT
jgi:hypothetical protein